MKRVLITFLALLCFSASPLANNSSAAFYALKYKASVLSSIVSVGFAHSRVSLLEGCATHYVRVNLSAPAAADVKVNFRFSGSFEGLDFHAPTEIIIPRGKLYALLPLRIVDDEEPEGLDEIYISVKAATNAVIGANDLLIIFVGDNDF